MDKQQAIQLMKQGKKISHPYFERHEYVTSNSKGTLYTFEDGVKCTNVEFWKYRDGPAWESGYSVWDKTAN